ncbi:MAG: Na/Pi symporter [Arenicellales bacterium]
MPLTRKLLLPVILLLLAYAFWRSSDFKQIASGVAIFLFGMLALEDGFQRFSGGLLERVLRYSTDRLWKALSFGIVTTTLMQSSSLVSVLTISFLSAGLINLAAGIGIIFGANLGTTTGAWLVAGFGLKVDLAAYAMPMLVFGIVMIFQKSPVWKGIGWVLAGIGFLFLGIHYMKEGFEAFRETIDLSAYGVIGLKGLLLFTLIGIAATVIMQSSHATLILTITALAAHQITYENALALSIGANMGTTITAILGSLSSNIAGKRLAGAHLIFNMVTGVIAIAFINQFLYAVEIISDFSGIADDNYTLRLAVFHTLFNLVGVIIMLPLTNKLVVFLEKVLREPVTAIKKPKYLNDAALESPPAALEVVRKESERLYDLATRVIAHGIGWKKSEVLGPDSLDELVESRHISRFENIDDAYETRIKRVYSAIMQFVIQARERITGTYGEDLQAYSRAGRMLVNAIKDIKHLQKNLQRFISSDNKAIKDAYNHLRTQVALVLRRIQEARDVEDTTESMLILDHALLEIEEDDLNTSDRIEPLIRTHAITAEMATSLMNDTDYVHSACRNLISTAKTLFTGRGASTMQLDQGLALSDEEMASIIQQDN